MASSIMSSTTSSSSSSSSALPERSCNTCHLVKKVQVCARCHFVPYCSESCQKDDWENHKPLCKKLKKENIKKLEMATESILSKRATSAINIVKMAEEGNKQRRRLVKAHKDLLLQLAEAKTTQQKKNLENRIFHSSRKSRIQLDKNFADLSKSISNHKDNMNKVRKSNKKISKIAPLRPPISTEHSEEDKKRFESVFDQLLKEQLTSIPYGGLITTPYTSLISSSQSSNSSSQNTSVDNEID